MNYIRSSEKGKAIVELALIVPFLMTIGLATLECLKYVRYEQFLSVVSREVGRAAFDCAYNTSGVANCLTNSINTAFPADVNGLLQNAAIVVSVWEFTAPGSNAVLVGRRVRNLTTNQGSNGAYVPATATSHFDGARVRGLNSYTAAKRRIVISEAIYSFPPLMGYFDGQFYSVTIL